jgi:hypothetical protein
MWTRLLVPSARSLSALKHCCAFNRLLKRAYQRASERVKAQARFVSLLTVYTTISQRFDRITFPLILENKCAPDTLMYYYYDF